MDYRYHIAGYEGFRLSTQNYSGLKLCIHFIISKDRGDVRLSFLKVIGKPNILLDYQLKIDSSVIEIGYSLTDFAPILVN